MLRLWPRSSQWRGGLSPGGGVAVLLRVDFAASLGSGGLPPVAMTLALMSWDGHSRSSSARLRGAEGRSVAGLRGGMANAVHGDGEQLLTTQHERDTGVAAQSRREGG